MVALFDNDQQKIGQTIGVDRIPVYDVKKIAKLVHDEEIDIAVIAVPARVAQRVLNQIMAAGVKAVLNFAPAPLVGRLGVKVKTVDLTTSLESLSYFLARPQAGAVTNGSPMKISAVTVMKARLSGRRKNTDASPPAISIERRKFSSIIGPSTKPSSIGASGNPSRMQRKPMTPNAAVM